MNGSDGLSLDTAPAQSLAYLNIVIHLELASLICSTNTLEEYSNPFFFPFA